MLKINNLIDEDSIYGNYDGDFGILHSSTNLETYHCREQFHDDYDKSSIFVAKYKPRIVCAAERRLKLPKNKRAVFERTDSKGWYHVTPKWWAEEAQRFSLFTILLRAGEDYRSLNEALKKEKYLRQTAGAVKAFLKGKTNYMAAEDEDDRNDYGDYHGWRDRHQGMDACVSLRFFSDKDLSKLNRLKKTKHFKEVQSFLENGFSSEAVAFALCKSK